MAPCSLSAWVELRRAKLTAKAIVLILRRCLAGWLAVQWVDDWIGAADLVIIDAPPHPETEARIAVRVARLWSVPFSHFHSTLWATAETLKIARDEGSLSS
jgi:chromosome partitioning protein